MIRIVVVCAAAMLLAGAWGIGRLRRRLVLVTVYGESMRPTYTAGDQLLVRRAPLGAVHRGDVVVVNRPGRPAGAPPEERLIVKRAVALPGDPVPAGVPVPDPTVPAQRLVVLGDNADASYDSRSAGYVRAEALLGVVLRPVGTRVAR